MIAFIKGTIYSIHLNYVIIDNQGIGYQVFMANTSAVTQNQEVFIFTYQHVREDAIILFGFLTVEEQSVFTRLISVKGVGPKTALAMLGACPGKQMIEAIEQNDVKLLKSLPGIGAKTAQQIVLDLKGKLVEEGSSTSDINQNLLNALDALKSLGYKNNAINSVKKELEKLEVLDVDQYVRQGLNLLAKRKGV